MRITNEHRKAINAAARDVCWLHHCEVGSRRDLDNRSRESWFNLRFLEDLGELNDDLDDIVELSKLKEIEDHPSGEAEIDVYVYHWIGSVRGPRDVELCTNLCVKFKDGKIISITQ